MSMNYLQIAAALYVLDPDGTTFRPFIRERCESSPSQVVWDTWVFKDTGDFLELRGDGATDASNISAKESPIQKPSE